MLKKFLNSKAFGGPKGQLFQDLQTVTYHEYSRESITRLLEAALEYGFREGCEVSFKEGIEEGRKQEAKNSKSHFHHGHYIGIKETYEVLIKELTKCVENERHFSYERQQGED